MRKQKHRSAQNATTGRGRWWKGACLAIVLVTVGQSAYWLTNTAKAQEKEASAVTAVVLGQSMKKEAEVPAAKADELKNRPIGMREFRAVVEVEDPSTLKAGDEVDISLVTLGGDHGHVEKILKKVRVQSVEVPRGEKPEPEKVVTAEEAGAEHVTPELYPTRVVTLQVTSGQLEKARVADAQGILRLSPYVDHANVGMLESIASNFVANLFQPLLLFFFMGFAIPLLHVPFEFPKALYQSLTIYLLVAIGWHGGELMAALAPSELAVAGGLAVVGFIVNGLIGIAATWMLRTFTPMRRIDAVTVGSYYGSDSAGTFVTCLGILATLGMLHDSYMPVMLAVMEIPGCLVGLFLISRLRRQGMDISGNMPDEAGYSGPASGDDSWNDGAGTGEEDPYAHDDSKKLVPKSVGAAAAHSGGILSPKILHEVFLNPGLFMLFGGLVVGFISGRQALVDPHVVEGPNNFFVMMFKGALCLFLLEMGITACRRLQDLKSAGVGFIIFGLLAPNLFALMGICALHAYSMALGHHFETGTYALMAVLCGAASYIAVPAVQRIAIPEASPTLPLAASLGLTFTWNVTLGIPIYIEMAKFVISTFPVT
ncbi:sodium-dependent bicarbonate transport family permease [Blastopirellula sp. J2-11]|uniref:sodium-dependent bicarbonate transport family permease n=1 Tax=Blastopirellula sp. J2-11 TaxID=2943192 RepID=UPI0021C7C2AD|nr:sodium-dependent bicarbonate transport family permease [Blastopirellula sp. J2-11]UUO04494.1 sodium-dependent bicarbonate transport family permease [Blastopirellula sp. J2-11]